jgi:uncharacterized membrane protein YfcA
MMDPLYRLIDPLYAYPFVFIGSPLIGITALLATISGLRKHRNWRNMWWIIACALITVITLWVPVHLLALFFYCTFRGCDFG